VAAMGSGDASAPALFIITPKGTLVYVASHMYLNKLKFLSQQLAKPVLRAFCLKTIDNVLR